MSKNWTFNYFREKLEAIERKLDAIIEKENDIMAQIDDLNAAIQAEDGQVTAMQAVLVKVSADITALLAKVAAGATPTDLTTQIQAIQAHVAALTTANAQLVADDASANK